MGGGGGCEHRLPVIDEADGVEKLFRFDVFEEETASTRGDGTCDEFFIIKGGEHDDLGVRVGGDELLRGLNAVEFGHLNVHEHNIDGFLVRNLGAVGNLPTHFHVGLGINKQAKAGSDKGLVVSKTDGDHRGISTFTRNSLLSVFTCMIPPRAVARSRMP